MCLCVCVCVGGGGGGGSIFFTVSDILEAFLLLYFYFHFFDRRVMKYILTVTH